MKNYNYDELKDKTAEGILAEKNAAAADLVENYKNKDINDLTEEEMQDAAKRIADIFLKDERFAGLYLLWKAFSQKEDGAKREDLELLWNSVIETLETAPEYENIPLLRIANDSITEEGEIIPGSVFNQLIEKARELLEGEPENAEEVNEFFDGLREYMVVPRPKGIEQFLNISVTGNSERLVKVTENITVAFSGRLAIEEQKINEMLRLAFANANPYGAKKGLHKTVEIGLSKTMEILGKPINANNKKAFTRKLRNEILPNISHTFIERRVKVKNKKSGKLEEITEHWEIGGGYWKVDPRNDTIIFKFNDEYAQYLNKGTFSQLNYRTLRLGTQKNPLPFYLAQKMQNQYFHDGNRNRTPATNSILSIDTILKWCANDFNNCLPSYEDLENTIGKDGRDETRHWGRRIRQPLETALNEIQGAGLFKWEYCGPSMKKATKKQTATADFYEWNKLYITFQLIPEEPDQSERLEHKRKRYENTQQKKAVADAEKIIKADKIQRRNEKKTAAKDA